MPVEPLVKGVWFVTARRYLVESHGASTLHDVARSMKEVHRPMLLEPLPSEWYPEDAFQDALSAVMLKLARQDMHRFAEFIEGCTVLGVNLFLRILLTITSPSFLMRKMPVLSRQYRQNDWECIVDAQEHAATLEWRGCPYLADRNYRMYMVAMLVKCTELCTKRRPTIEVVGHGKDWIKLKVLY
jgi:hypothetical protein